MAAASVGEGRRFEKPCGGEGRVIHSTATRYSHMKVRARGHSEMKVRKGSAMMKKNVVLNHAIAKVLSTRCRHIMHFQGLGGAGEAAERESDWSGFAKAPQLVQTGNSSQDITTSCADDSGKLH